MRRVNTKGIGLANKCMTMAAIAYNLKKLMRMAIQKSAGRYKSNTTQVGISLLNAKEHH